MTNIPGDSIVFFSPSCPIYSSLQNAEEQIEKDHQDLTFE